MCLNVDEKFRISIAQIAETPYMKKISMQIEGNFSITAFRQSKD